MKIMEIFWTRNETNCGENQKLFHGTLKRLRQNKLRGLTNIKDNEGHIPNGTHDIIINR